MVELYRNAGLDVYEKAHYAHGEHIDEVGKILTWYTRSASRVLDVGCSGGLHALEFAARGHRVTGIDVEPSAVAVARKRNQERHLDARFHLMDIERDDLAGLGAFELIYSIGNVLSHVAKARLGATLQKIRTCCADDGVVLFDLLMIGPDFPEEVREDGLGIVWKRKLDVATGMIELRGDFADFALSQEFQVWGYTVEEAVSLLERAGFTAIEYADSLDFSPTRTKNGNPVCLRFRARG